MAITHVVAIPLTKGKYALIDPEDAERVRRFKWRVLELRRKDRFGDERILSYAHTTVRINGKPMSLYLHRFIMNPPAGMMIDHKDGNGLNCRRGNMRVATNGQNQGNAAGRRGTSRFKGVSWEANRRRWQAKIVVARRHHFLGYFTDEEDAARAYDQAAVTYQGEFAVLNFPVEGEANVLR